MPETNDNAAKIALSQDARDSLNAITQEAFANAEYLDSLFASRKTLTSLRVDGARFPKRRIACGKNRAQSRRALAVAPPLLG